MKRNEKVLLGLATLSFIVSYVLKGPYIVSSLLFFGLFSLWLSYEHPKRIKQPFVFALIFGIGLVIFVDVIAITSGAWEIPHSLFPIRVFDIVPIEDMVLAFLYMYVVTLFNDVTYEQSSPKLCIPALLLVAFLLVGTIFIFWSIDISLLDIPYAYVWFGSLIFFPALLYIFWTNFSANIIRLSIVFFIVLFLFEIIGIHLNHWTFTEEGEYLAWIIFPMKSIPLEELIFWMIFASPAITGYYKLFQRS